MKGIGLGTRATRAIVLGLWFALSIGCAGGGTGTGSSGLIGAEGVLVSRVVETGTCEQFDGVDYCPADKPDALPSGKFISTPFDEESSIGCFRSESGTALCVFVFSFEPRGFEKEGEFVIAIRDFETDQPWELFSLREPLTEEEEDADLIITEIVIDLADESGEELQLAILAFPEAVVDLPETTETLAELGAEAVFLTPRLEAIPELPDEDSAIAEVRSSGTCVVAGVVKFCPTGVTFDEGTLEPAIGPPPLRADSRVEITTPTPARCQLQADGKGCLVDIDFSVLGDVGFYYRMAARVVGGQGVWELGEEVEEPPEFFVDEPRSFVAEAYVDLAGRSGEVHEVDLAILVDALDPADLPDTVAQLNEAVPVYAFFGMPFRITVTE